MEVINKEWIDAEEAADLLSITYGALRNMVYRREVPFYKLGRRLRFKYSELYQFLEQTRIGVKEWGRADKAS